MAVMRLGLYLTLSMCWYVLLCLAIVLSAHLVCVAVSLFLLRPAAVGICFHVWSAVALQVASFCLFWANADHPEIAIN